MAWLPNWHPFLVHFPIALYTTAFVCDVSLLVRFRRGWLDRACVLLYVGAALGSVAAALSGKLAANAMADSLEPDVNDDRRRSTLKLFLQLFALDARNRHTSE